MALEFSSAGITVKYCIETTSGTRPTSNYTVLPNIKSTPDFNPEPATIEVTDLSDTSFKRFIPGLRDISSSVGFGANLSTTFKTAWETMCTAATTGKASNKACWFEICIPNFDSFYFSGMPLDLGIGALSVDSVVEVTGYITPNEIVGWANASA